MNATQSQNLPEGCLIGWYGDDFTGSAAVMEALAFAGLDAVLFLDLPSSDQVSRFPDARAIGIAGTARSRSPDWMQTHLPPMFQFLNRLGAPIVQYKVCSTLDSLPTIGSIGKAADIAANIIDSVWMPLFLASPEIRRYQAFGQLFAGAPDGVFRLDRHPVMARHPVTPMDEADVRLHVGKQTDKSFGLVDLEALQSPQTASECLSKEIAAGSEIIALDATDEKTMTEVGRLIWENRGKKLLAIGSQGIEYALVDYWQSAGMIESVGDYPAASEAERVIVVSGSVSETTASQIAWAAENGFKPIKFDSTAIARGEEQIERAIDASIGAAMLALQAGADPIVYSARGPDDTAVVEFHAALSSSGLSLDEGNRQLGEALGKVLARLIDQTGTRRAIIAGGDTSGHAMSQLGIFAIKALAPTVPGAALFQAFATDPQHDGLEIALKGGQMGTTDYFGWIKKGGGSANSQRTSS